MSEIKCVVIKGIKKYENDIKRIYHQFDTDNGGEFPTKYGTTFEYYDKRAKINGKTPFTICAFDGDKLVGFLEVSDSSYKGYLHVLILAVDEKYRNQGVGQKLMDYAIHHSKGYKGVISEAFLKNTPSVKLHLKMGFKLMKSEFVYVRQPNSKIFSKDNLKEYLTFQRTLAESEKNEAISSTEEDEENTI